jgi:hypothetical protein
MWGSCEHTAAGARCRFNFSKSQETRSFETVIASAAKQSISPRKEWIASLRSQ